MGDRLEMDEKWVILHRRHHIFLREVGFNQPLGRVAKFWTVYLEEALGFPSEQGANAVIEELFLEDFAEPCVICTSEG